MFWGIKLSFLLYLYYICAIFNYLYGQCMDLVLVSLMASVYQSVVYVGMTTTLCVLLRRLITDLLVVLCEISAKFWNLVLKTLLIEVIVRFRRLCPVILLVCELHPNIRKRPIHSPISILAAYHDTITTCSPYSIVLLWITNARLILMPRGMAIDVYMTIFLANFASRLFL